MYLFFRLKVTLCSVKAHLSIEVLVEIQYPKSPLEFQPKLSFKASVLIGNLRYCILIYFASGAVDDRYDLNIAIIKSLPFFEKDVTMN